MDKEIKYLLEAQKYFDLLMEKELESKGEE